MNLEKNCNEPKVDLRDELDASIECGSGYISLFGPPSSGKTTLLLQYLVAREQHIKNMHKSFHLEYVSGKSLDKDPLQRLTWRLQPQKKRRRAECSLIQFGCIVRQWLESAVAGSEIHLVLDDADAMEEENIKDINHWLSGCLSVGTQECHGNIICLWIISQMPLRISNCFRFHFVPKPDVSMLCEWLENLFKSNHSLFINESETGDRNQLTLEQTHTAVMEAVQYYTTHLPMRASLISQDFRQLLQRIHNRLPLFINIHAAGGRLNAMHLSAAWAGHRREFTSTIKEGGGENKREETNNNNNNSDPLVAALQRIGYSAMLWALSAFYCGAVPKSKHAYVFDGQELRRRTNTTETNATSHKAAVLSSSSHIVHVPRLMMLYRALLKICIHHVDPLELAPAEVAVQHHHTLVSWGLLVASSQSSRGYYCYIPITSAVGLSKLLSLNLYDLIPR